MFKRPVHASRCALGATLLMSFGVASAQSSVTLYGIVDGSLIYTSKTAGPAGQNEGRTFAMTDSGWAPSQFGFTGTEDLGGGLKVNFKLESGINVANGGFNDSNGNLFGRQAWVALDGDFGEIKSGLQFSPFFLAIRDSDPRSFSHFGSGLVNYADNVVLTGAFNANAVSYSSPKIKGFEGSVMLALGGEAGDFQAGRQYSANLKYDNGSLMVNAAFYDGNSGGTVQTPVPTTLEFEGRTLGAGYRFGALTVRASFVNYKVAGSFNDNVYGGGADYYVLPQLDLNAGVWVTTDRNHTANHSVMAALGTEYLISKRTSIYMQAGMVDNHGAMNTGLAINGALNGAAGTTVGVNLGVEHKF